MLGSFQTSMLQTRGSFPFYRWIFSLYLVGGQARKTHFVFEVGARLPWRPMTLGIRVPPSFKTIISYVDEQFERYLHDESGLNRRHIVDNRVHCCFYFISPFGHG